MSCPQYKQVDVDWPWPIAPYEETDLAKTETPTVGRRRIYFTPIEPITPWTDLLTSTTQTMHLGFGVGSTVALQEITDFFDPDNGPSTTGKYVEWNGLPLMTITMYTTKEEVLNILYIQQTNSTVSPQLRGLKDIFDNENPFVDVASPTLLEVEYWNYRVFLHIRNLLGITTEFINWRGDTLYAQWEMQLDVVTMAGDPPTDPGPIPLTEKPCPDQTVYVTFGEPCYSAEGGQRIMLNSRPRGWFDVLQQALYELLQNYEFQESPFMDIMNASTVGFGFQLIGPDTDIRTTIVYS